MTTNDSFDRRLSAWLHEDASGRVPAHLEEVLVATVATRQRRAWSSPERWLPVLTFRGRPVPSLAIVGLLLLTLLALVAAGLAGLNPQRPVVAVPSSSEAPGPIASAPTSAPTHRPLGMLAFIDGSTIRFANGDGSNVRTVFDNGDLAWRSVRWSPRGDLLAATADDGRIVVLGADGSLVSDSDRWARPWWPLPTDMGVSWSPDGASLLYFAQFSNTSTAPPPGAPTAGIGLARVSTADWTTVEGSGIGVSVANAALSPSGKWFAYLVDNGHGAFDLGLTPVVGGLPGVTGRDTRITLGTSPEFGAPVWAPDPARERLAVVEGNNEALGAKVLMIDVGSATAPMRSTRVSYGFWPTWTADGRQLAWWGDGTTKAVNAQGLLDGTWRVMPLQAGTGVCDAIPDVSGKAICGAVQWSPDGSAIAGPDLGGRHLVILTIDGSREAVAISMSAGGNASHPLAGVAWQPAAP
ncbi:MAG TPA: hypothetical protein VF484_06455 [Candidatus Limnocylindrales bacterium]